MHSLAEALAAVEAAAKSQSQVTLLSAPHAARSVGPGWFKSVLARARAHRPGAVKEGILDCADSAGAAMAAIRLGEIDGLVLRARPLVLNKIAVMARARGIAVYACAPALASSSASSDGRWKLR